MKKLNINSIKIMKYLRKGLSLKSIYLAYCCYVDNRMMMEVIVYDEPRCAVSDTCERCSVPTRATK